MTIVLKLHQKKGQYKKCWTSYIGSFKWVGKAEKGLSIFEN